MGSNPVTYEDPAPSTSVSLDDVGVKRQKATRKAAAEPTQEHKWVHNTIAHIAHAGQAYVINGHGVAQVLRLVLAFLLHNQLLTDNLLFFVDGQRTLYTAILGAFGWLISFQIIPWPGQAGLVPSRETLQRTDEFGDERPGDT